MGSKIYQSHSNLHTERAHAFEHFGWAVFPSFFDTAAVNQLKSYADELFAMPERSGEHMVYREKSLLDASRQVVQRIEDFCSFHAGFDALIRTGSLINTAAALLGAPLTLFKDKINFKAPGGGGFEAHQDQQAGWSRYAPLFITALVSIDAATVENGCLEMADMPRPKELIGTEWEPLNASQLQDLRFTSLPTRPGDVVFFDSYVVHRSQPNLTTHGRRVLYVTYNRASDGDQRAQYYADKRASFPPDIDRLPGRDYRFRV
jgi:ectoine hydroxylase-related dioxygenase (phytanoyl-CoA dioxygenase family)